MRKMLSTVVLTILVLSLSTGAFAQDDDMEMEGTSFMDKLAVGAVVGLSEPWSGVGDKYETGFMLLVIANYDLNDKVENLSAELHVGFSSYSSVGEGDGSASVIPILLNAKYDITSITPEIGVFGFGGLGLNLHSWSVASGTNELGGQTVIGLNGGVGVSYKINPQINAQLRVGAYLSLTSGRELDSGASIEEDYEHLNTPFMVGISYKL